MVFINWQLVGQAQALSKTKLPKRINTFTPVSSEAAQAGNLLAAFNSALFGWRPGHLFR